jgi:hypothetical protein
MRIALVLCPSWAVESPSYTLALLSANLKSHGHEVKCFDLNAEMFRHCSAKEDIDTWRMDEKGYCWYEEKYVADFMKRHALYVDSRIKNILEYEPDVIGFTVYSTSRYFSYEIARLIKEKDKKKIIVFGGPQCFKNCEGPDILKRNYIDAVCFGEGDTAFSKFLDAIKIDKGIVKKSPGFCLKGRNGEIIDCGEEDLVKDLNNLPYADYSDFNLAMYTKKLLPIATSRGCLGRCKFCNESPHWKKYRHRTALNIYNEIFYQLNKYPQVNEFWFNDSLINGDMSMLNELCDLLIKNKLNIKYGGQALIRPEMKYGLLKKMKESGCTLISFGLESGSSAVLRKMGKSYNAKTAEKVIKNTCEAGISVIFNIIVGFPGETEKEIEETKKFIERNLNYAKEISIMPLLLLKGSYLYDNAEKIGVDLNTKHDQLRWKAADNSSNHELRIKRLNLLKESIGKKAYTTCVDKLKSSNPIERFLPNLCIELSSLCNLKCYMCAHNTGSSVHGESCKNGFMDMRVWDNILKGLEKQTKLIESITLYWLGESLLHPNFQIMLSQLLELNIRKNVFSNLFINTNGIYFDPKISKILLDYADFIQNNGKNKGCYLNIHFSIETLNPETYIKIKGADSKTLDVILKNIDFLVKERCKRKLDLPNLTFGAVVLEDNADEAGSFDKYWKDYLKQYGRDCETIFDTQYFYDKDAVYFRRLEGTFNSQRGEATQKKYSEIVSKFGGSAVEQKQGNRETDTSLERKPCFQLWNMFMIARDGKITPCCKDMFLELTIGDLNKESLSEVLYGPKIQQMRMDHIYGEFHRYKICAECKDPPGGFLSDEDVKMYLQDNEGVKKKPDKRLNICLVSREYPVETGWGGIGTYTYNLAHGLAERGHNIHVISQSMSGKDVDYMDGIVNVHRVVHREMFFHNWPFREFSLRLEYSGSVYLKLKEIIKKYKIDIVEAPNLSAEAFIYCLNKNTPLVTRLHTHFSEAIKFYGMPKSFDFRISCLLEDAAIRMSDLVVCSTRAHAFLVAEETGFKKEEIKIIPLGISLPREHLLKAPENQRPIVLFVGRLEKRKGAHTLAEAVPLVLKKIPDVEFIFIGRDTFVSNDFVSVNGKDKHSFQKFVEGKIPVSCRENVKFLGYIDQKKLPYYYNLCDVFAAPSLYESFGLIYIEAMSYGKPVIGCSAGGVPELINSGVNGILVPPEDSSALALEIVNLLKNKEARKKMGAEARRHVENCFSRDLMIERTEKAYLDLIA